MKFFILCNRFYDFEQIWKKYSYIIFQNGQGLGLDINVDNDFHTSSNTGLTNPYKMICDYRNYEAQVCYVTRTYLTRHGDGPLENEVDSMIDISSVEFDKTNIYNIFQGQFRYGILDKQKMFDRIEKDYCIVNEDPRFKKKIAVTHVTNSYINKWKYATYISKSKLSVQKQKT